MSTKAGRRNNPAGIDGKDFYKVLNVRKNARPETIKQSYIQLVRQFPPETHPEEFQQIRRAYEVLRDPAQRGQYDIFRKYGSELGDLMDRAVSLATAQNWKEAAKILNTVIDMVPQFPGAYILLARTLLAEGKQSEFETTMGRAFQAAEAADDRLTVLLVKANLLVEAGQPERAMAVLDEAEEQFPGEGAIIARVRVNALIDLERVEEAFRLAAAQIPAPEFDDPEHFGAFLLWINALVQGSLWKYWSTVKTRVRKFLRSVTSEDDKVMVVSAFGHESREWEKAGHFQAALAFTAFCLDVQPKDPELLERRKELERLQRLAAEIERLAADYSIFPWVTFYAFRWYRAMGMPEEDLELLMREELSEEEQAFFEELADKHEDFAAGILRLQKKYPALYHQFQEDWEKLFAEQTAGLNREARRRLR